MAEVFENIALGMMALVLEPETIRPSQSVELRAKGNDNASLLVSWLAEILFQMETAGLAFGKFKVYEIRDLEVKGQGLGEPLDLTRHKIGMEIKAPTYHMLELKEEAGRWVAQVIFDV
jgi:SHS2 domain-containing protein